MSDKMRLYPWQWAILARVLPEPEASKYRRLALLYRLRQDLRFLSRRRYMAAEFPPFR